MTNEEKKIKTISARIDEETKKWYDDFEYIDAEMGIDIKKGQSRKISKVLQTIPKILDNNDLEIDILYDKITRLTTELKEAKKV